MDCIAPCPTGSIDKWRVVDKPYSLDEQFGWTELPAQQNFAAECRGGASIEAIDPDIARLLAEAHAGAGGRAKAPRSATKPTINLYTLAKPAEATVQGNYRLTAGGADSDVRHIILDFGAQPFPVLEGQSVGVIPPGVDAGRQAASAAPLFGIEPARRRTAEFQQPFSDREARARRRRLQLCVRSEEGRQGPRRRAVRRDVPDAERSEGAAVDDLHRHRLGAVSRLHDAPSAQRRGIPSA